MENEDDNSDIESKLESIAGCVKELRSQASGKRLRFPSDFRDEVTALVTSGVKINRICTVAGLAYSCVLAWVKKDSKFKSLNVVKVRKRRKKKLKTKVIQRPSKPALTYGLRFSSGAELEAIELEGLVLLLERGLL